MKEWFILLQPDTDMIVDEEGLIKDLDLNAAATELYIQSGYRSVIVGKALIGKIGERSGEPDIVGFETSDEAMMTIDKIRRDSSARQMIHNLKKYTGGVSYA